ncbi:MAG: hypothetical protein R3C68_08035 [Myxococcota bacterium]
MEQSNHNACGGRFSGNHLGYHHVASHLYDLRMARQRFLTPMVVRRHRVRNWNVLGTVARIGRQVSADPEFGDGFIDEVRVSAVARSGN